MSFLQWIKRRFYIPGEPITLLGFEHGGKAFRFIDGWVKYPNGLTMCRFADQAGDIKTADPIMKMKAASLPDGLLTRVGKSIKIIRKTTVTDPLAEDGEQKEFVKEEFRYEETDEPYVDPDDGTYLLRVDPKLALILDADERPEGLAFPMDMDTATGLFLEGKRRKVQKRVLPSGLCAVIVDPVTKYFRTNPELYCVAADTALSAGLLRVKMQWWKTLLLAFFAFLFGMMFHL
jgi:hypothetical protein